MLKQMISIDPINRPTFDTILHTSRGTIFLESFYSFLHNYVSSVNESTAPPLTANSPPGPSPMGAPSMTPTISSTTTNRHSGAPIYTANTNAENANDTQPNDSDHRIDRIWEDYESVEPYLISDNSEEVVMDAKVDYYTSPPSSSRPYQVGFV